MDFQMTATQIADTERYAESVNRQFSTSVKNELGKDSFLKLLVTQLQNQDPTRPMEDREFISQMAQFSSLEQMTNLNNELKHLIQSSRSSEAYGLIGKEVDSYDPVRNRRVSGVVSSVRYEQGSVRLMVNNESVDINNINTVRNPDDRSSVQDNK